MPWNQRVEDRFVASTSELDRLAACLNMRPNPRTVSTHFDRGATWQTASPDPQRGCLENHGFGTLAEFSQRITMAMTVTGEFPRGCGFLANQLNRAALSIAGSIATGNGRFTKADQQAG